MKRRSRLVFGYLANPHRSVLLTYARPTNGNPGDLVVAHHWCAPGLFSGVRDYIRAHPTLPGSLPERVSRHRSIYLDPGGSCASDTSLVLVDAGGFYVSCLLDLAYAVIGMLEHAAVKRFGDTDCVRLGSWSGAGTYRVVLRPNQRDAALRHLRPLADASLGEAIAQKQRISQSPHVLVPGFPLAEVSE